LADSLDSRRIRSREVLFELLGQIFFHSMVDALEATFSAGRLSIGGAVVIVDRAIDARI
jgi:hypothetical protein